MNPNLRIALALAGLAVLGAVTHLVPHDLGVSTVGAVSMLAAAYLPRRLMLVPVLITIAAYDVVHGTYSLPAMALVYAAYLAGAVAVAPTLGRVSATTVTSAAVLNAAVFYLVSNIVPMVMGYYPGTPAGWLACYVNGLPFLARGILANLAFGGVAFGTVYCVGLIRAHRIAAAQRY